MKNLHLEENGSPEKSPCKIRELMGKVLFILICSISLNQRKHQNLACLWLVCVVTWRFKGSLPFNFQANTAVYKGKNKIC